MGDNCNNCPENNPQTSRIALRIDTLEKWQGNHDERYSSREEQRQKDKRGVVLAVTTAIIMMILTSVYNTFLAKVGSNAENNFTRMQKYSDQNIEYSTGGRGRSVHDRNAAEVNK
jgi:hypothetical protein